jgi:hypothetical protein
MNALGNCHRGPIQQIDIDVIIYRRSFIINMGEAAPLGSALCRHSIMDRATPESEHKLHFSTKEGARCSVLFEMVYWPKVQLDDREILSKELRATRRASDVELSRPSEGQRPRLPGQQDHRHGGRKHGPVIPSVPLPGRSPSAC